MTRTICGPNFAEIFRIDHRRRGELENELDDFVGTGTNYRILRGFIKLLNDRSEFETSSVAEPFEIRQKIFLEAGKFQPVFLHSDKRTEILQTVAGEFETDPETLFNQIFADLSGNQRLIEFETISPNDLLERYNLAQAQALLYKCVEMKIRIALRTRQLRASSAGSKVRLSHRLSNAATATKELLRARLPFHRSQQYAFKFRFPPASFGHYWSVRRKRAEKGRNVFYELRATGRIDFMLFYEPDIRPFRYESSKLLEKTDSGLASSGNKEVIDLGKPRHPDFVLLRPIIKSFPGRAGFGRESVQKRLEESKRKVENFILAAEKI